jgi:HK97 family phage prohead protease
MKYQRRDGVNLERRDIDGDAATIDDTGKIRGTAIVFNQWTTIGAGPMRFRERVGDRAVTKTLAEMDVIYLDNHDTAKPLARKSAGNLDIQVRDGAVHYLADPTDTTYARDLKANIRGKVIRGNSFGFEVVKDKWEIGEDGVDERTLLEIKLPEISACTFPAYEQTDIGMREAYETAMEARDRFYGKNPEARAAKATYSDLTTCGSCGATGQYGAYCTNCGVPMGSMDDSADNYCQYCGAPMSDSREAHVCERRDGKEPYGDVEYADPGYQKDKKKRYPVDTKEHAKAAWSYVNKVKNAAAYTASQLASIKSKIKAALKKFGVKVSSDRDFSDFDLRNYNPEVGLVSKHEERDDAELETRDDPDGDEVAAMHTALQHLADGDIDAARAALEDALTGADDEDADTTGNAEDHLVAHTEQGGAAVPLRAAINEAYEAVRELPPTSRTNAVLAILEPHLRTPDDEQRGEPKPDASTSEKGVDEDSLIDMKKRWLDTQREYRSLSR